MAKRKLYSYPIEKLVQYGISVVIRYIRLPVVLTIHMQSSCPQYLLDTA